MFQNLSPTISTTLDLVTYQYMITICPEKNVRELILDYCQKQITIWTGSLVISGDKYARNDLIKKPIATQNSIELHYPRIRC